MDPQYLRKLIDELQTLDLAQAQLAFVKLLNEYSQYFSPNSNYSDEKVLSVCFSILYDEFRRLSNVLIEYENYQKSCMLFRQFETIMMYADIRKIVYFNSWLEFHYDLCKLLELTNNELAAIHRIDSLIGKYKYQSYVILERIKSEDDLQKKSVSDISYCLSYLIKHCKLAIAICNRTGDRLQIGKFLYYEKLLTEKLYYSKDQLSYEFQFATLKRRYFIPNEMDHVVLNPKMIAKGLKLRLLNTKYLLRGILYSFFRLTTGYGEKPERLLIVSCIIVVMFSIIYSLLTAQPSENLLSFWFESITIFSTFGLIENTLGNSIFTRIAISFEIAFGILCINGYIVLLARKYLR